jgi:hypothetical protein
MPAEPAPEANATLPDLPPPELQQGEAGPGGEEQVEAPISAPTDGTGKHLTTRGELPRNRRSMLKIPELAGAQQPPPKGAAGTSRRSDELLGTDLVDDPMLTDNNIENFKKAYDFALVRPEYFPAGEHCRVAYLNLPPYAECDHPLSGKIRKAENHCG